MPLCRLLLLASCPPRTGQARAPVKHALHERYIYLESEGRLPTVKWKKYNTSLPQKETSC